jgi:hypothetical protein
MVSSKLLTYQYNSQVETVICFSLVDGFEVEIV